MELKQKRSCDLLVLGSGIAGLSAALAGAEAGASVVLACKGKLFSGSSFYPGTWGLGLIGPADEADEEDLVRTIEAVGCGMARDELVRALVSGIHPAIARLESMGVKLRKAQGGADQREYIPCFDHKHRAWNGIEFDSAREVFSRKLEEMNVTVLPGREALELCREDGRVCGAVLSDGETLEYVSSRAVVLATGGYGSLFRHHLCTGDVEGLGQALALDAGCSLINMEFMQIMPGYLRPAYQTIFNEKVFRFTHMEADGREILPEADRERLLDLRSGHGPFTSRLASGEVDLAICRAGEGVAVRYDRELMENPPEFVKTYFDWLEQAKGLTMADPIRIGLFSHAANGGVRIETDGSTGVPGLFAAGEVTGGMHGADRIGGLSTANGLVFGGKAGTAAAKCAVEMPEPPASVEFLMEGGADCAGKFRRLQEVMSRYAMAEREGAGLTAALREVETMTAELDLHPTEQVGEITASRRLMGQLKTARVILSAELLREESRGSHYRADHPEENPALARRIRAEEGEQGVEVRFED